MTLSNVARSRRAFAAAIGVALALAAAPSPSRADDYPSRPITILVPFAPGGSSDTIMRLLAQRVSENMKHTIVIENRPGAAGNVAAMAIKNAKPDGYLLMLGHTGSHAINVTLYSDLKYDPVKDFQPITALIAFNNILVVPTTSPAKSPAELAALGKSKPEGLTYGSQGVGTGGHLLGVLFAKYAHVKMVHVPYRGVAPALTDTVAGRVDMMFASYLSVGPHAQAGKLRTLALAGTKRHPALPDLPTMTEAGFPEVHMQQWFGLFAPAGTPASVVQKLNAEFVKVLKSDEVKNKVEKQGVFVTPSTPEELGAMVKRDIVRLGAVVKESGAKKADR